MLASNVAIDNQGNRSLHPALSLPLAALPHLLMSSAFFGVSVAFGGRGMPWYPYFLLIFLIGGLLLAWRLNWPLWSGSWAGYGLLLVTLPPLTLIGPLLPSSDRLFLLSLALGCLIIAYFRPLHALLASLPLLVFLPRLFYFEHLKYGNLVHGGVFVLLALISTLIVWRGSWRVAIAGAILFHLIAGAAYSIGHFYLPFDLGPYSAGMQAAPRLVPATADLLRHFLPLTLAGIAGSLATLVAHRISRRQPLT